MDISNLTKWLTDPALQAVLSGVFIMFVARWVTGIAAAVRDGTFQWSATASILRVDGAQVAMVVGLALLAGNLQTPLGVLAAGAAASYGIKALASVKDNLGDLATPDPDRNPVPTLK